MGKSPHPAFLNLRAAGEESDYRSDPILSWFVSEQIEEEAIGFGSVTRALLPMLRAFRLRQILLYSGHASRQEVLEHGAELADLDSLLSCSDIVTVQTSLTPRTHHLLNGANLGLIRDGALLLNVGRGELIDEQALIHHLKQNRFRTVLDVCAVEPLPAR